MSTLILGLDDLLHFSDEVINPLSNMVSLHPLSARHDGHVLMSAWATHLATHFSQPTMVLQHLLIMIGGVIGTERQILHLSMSYNNRCTPSGILASLFRVNISLIAFLSSPTSFMSTFRFFSRMLHPDSFAFGLQKSASSSESMMEWRHFRDTGLLSSISFLETACGFSTGICKM